MSTNKLQFQKILSYDELDLTSLPINSIVMFDLDDTIFRQKDHLMRNVNSKPRAELLSILEKKHGGLLSVNHLFHHCEHEIMEKCIPDFIQKLRSLGIKTFGFTARRTGYLCETDAIAIEQLTIDLITKLGIEFDTCYGNIILESINSTTYPEQTIEPHLKDHLRSNAMMKSGILFSNNLDKGFIMELFMAETNLSPTVVVLIDDRYENLESMQKLFLKKKNSLTKFIGIQYSRSFELGDSTLNPNIVSLQMDLMEKTGQFMSDAEAESLLRK
jgi:hypothetical protein